jgi:SET domain-containing protein
MKTKVQNSRLHGRGVFATKKIRKGETIEVCPAIVVPKKKINHIKNTPLADYYFIWDNGDPAIVLGNGSLYNHSYCPNAKYGKYENNTITFTAIETINVGEEITVNYNGEPYCQNKVWFD